jgi:pSer/pThr/pTyr-binding forkhead associated (FHA) protein
VRGGLARNGTFMNGDRVDGEVRFGPGDVLRIGRTLITLHDEHAEPLPVAVR